ncbi:acyl-CoA/acyl-ACP dehydrogenase [Myxococcota bacterium]|nr:acyl-CoA/acyl-ACP dehydrogenase [Myxococcota bacterium]
MKTAPKDFGFGSDEELLRDSARRFLDETLPIEKLRDLVAADPESVYERGEPTSWQPEIWKQMIELGWPGLAVPEELGGVGFKMAGIVGLVEEVGRHAVPSPLVSTLNAAYVLRAANSDAAGPWLERLVDGAAASLAMTGETASWEPEDCALTGRFEGDALIVEGTAFFVQDAGKADWFVANARVGDETLLVVVSADAEGVSVSSDHIHDLTRDQATVAFDGVQVPAEGRISGDGVEALRSAWPAILVTVAADLCGTSEWQLQTTVEYAKTRKQFDRQLGFFQAVKHPLVDAMMGIDRARSLLYHAACCIDQQEPDAEQTARMAKSAASDAGAYMSDRSVQLHGGIGFTWECDVHVYFKRSLHNQALYGDGTEQRRKLADAVIGSIGESRAPGA